MSTRTEEFIVAKTARNAILAGYSIRVNDGECVSRPTRDLETIMRDATATEDTTLLIYDMAQRKVVGAVYFVFGNDIDVLLLYDGSVTADAVAAKVREIIAMGKSVSAEKTVPEKLRFGEITDMRGGDAK